MRGDFWRFYQGVKDAESFLGYPITEEFRDKNGVLVQYFQRARLEVQGGVVRLSPLGRLTYQQGAQLRINNPLACRSYDTGFSVCFAFLEYFDAHGGEALLGKPISPFEYQDDRIVQYFENGRLEWNPAKPDGQRVVMGELGSTYFYASGESLARLDDVEPLSGTTQVLSLRVRAFPWKAVTNSTDQQVIFVIVQDQTLQPIFEATGSATVHWTNGAETTLPLVTNDKGVATLALPVENQPYGGLVMIEVRVQHGALIGQTTTSFRIWY